MELVILDELVDNIMLGNWYEKIGLFETRDIVLGIRWDLSR